MAGSAMLVAPFDDADEKKRRRWIEFAIWTAVMVLAFSRFAYLGYGDLEDWDECLYAWRSKIIVFRGEWLDQSDLAWREFYSAAFPPLQVWFTAIMFHVFGISEFTARFWSALTGAGSVIVLFLMGRRLGRSQWTGLFAALFLASVWHWTKYSRRAQFDVPFTFFICASIYCYLGYLDSLQTVGPRFVETRRKAWWWLVIAGAALGLGLMNKIALALMAPTVVGGLSLYGWMRGRHPLRRVLVEQLIVNGVAFAVVLPWHLAMTLSTKSEAFWAQYIGYHLLGRATHDLEAHAGPWHYYFQTLWLNLPVALFAIAIVAVVWFAIALVASFWNRREGGDGWSDADTDLDSPLRFHDTRYLLPLLWLGFQLALFSLASTKRETYAIPMYPPIALMGAMFLGERLRDSKRLGLLAVTLYSVTVFGLLSRMKSFAKQLEEAFANFGAIGPFGDVFLNLGLLLLGIAVLTIALYLTFYSWRGSFHRIALALILGASIILSLRQARKVFDPTEGMRTFGWHQMRGYLDAMDEYDYLIFAGTYAHPGAMYYLNGLNQREWHPRINFMPMPNYDPKIIGAIDSEEEVRVVVMKSWVNQNWKPEELQDLRNRLVLLAEGGDLEIYRMKRR